MPSSGKGEASTSQSNDTVPSHQVSEHLVEALCYVLGNSIRLAQITQSYGWNLPETTPQPVHEMFAVHLTELNDAADEIAKYIAGLVPGCVSEFVDVTVDVNPTSPGETPNPAKMFRNLRLAHEQAILSLEAAVEVASEFEDPDTQRLLDVRLASHRSKLTELMDQISEQARELDHPKPH